MADSAPKTRARLFAMALLAAWTGVVAAFVVARMPLQVELRDARAAFLAKRETHGEASAARREAEERLLRARTDPGAAIDEARRRMTMVRPGETVYRLTPGGAPPTGEAQQAP
ncbi:MAG: hypothetical protein SF028_12910 [Candidatus Sumerlaeia bacterium]|nr:hypothetical protein [Candidatus Sumerlaeia bacterium]